MDLKSKSDIVRCLSFLEGVTVGLDERLARIIIDRISDIYNILDKIPTEPILLEGDMNHEEIH